MGAEFSPVGTGLSLMQRSQGGAMAASPMSAQQPLAGFHGPHLPFSGAPSDHTATLATGAVRSPSPMGPSSLLSPPHSLPAPVRQAYEVTLLQSPALQPPWLSSQPSLAPSQNPHPAHSVVPLGPLAESSAVAFTPPGMTPSQGSQPFPAGTQQAPSFKDHAQLGGHSPLAAPPIGGNPIGGHLLSSMPQPPASPLAGNPPAGAQQPTASPISGYALTAVTRHQKSPMVSAQQLWRQPRTVPGVVPRLLQRELGMACSSGCRLLPAQELAGRLQHAKTSRGHRAAVYCIAFDRIGSLVVTGSDDRLVKVRSAWTVMKHACRPPKRALCCAALYLLDCIRDSSDHRIVNVVPAASLPVSACVRYFQGRKTLHSIWMQQQP